MKSVIYWIFAFVLAILGAYVLDYFEKRKAFNKLKESFLFPVEDLKMDLLKAASECEHVNEVFDIRFLIDKIRELAGKMGKVDIDEVMFCKTRHALSDIVWFQFQIASNSLKEKNYYAAIGALIISNREVMNQKIVK